MKKTLIIAAMSAMFFAACSNEAKQETATDSLTTDTAVTAVDTNTTTDSLAAPVDSTAIDSATKAHGHSH